MLALNLMIPTRVRRRLALLEVAAIAKQVLAAPHGQA